MNYFDPTAQVRSLYMHWPFCPYKCHFCPFVALAGQDEFMQDYHNALVKEVIDFAGAREVKCPLDTLFIGGGTPSTYPPELLLDMFGTLYSKYEFAENAEITLEVNPGTVTHEKLDTWKKVGINRLSIGVQSLNNQVLKGLNRHQSATDVYALLHDAQDMFDNLSVDLIVGLPGISAEEWKAFVEQVVTWPIKHVSMYFLTVHEDTPLYFGVKQQKIILPTDDTVVDLYYWTIERFNKAGLYQYEISNFARTGYESRHNSVYWQRKAYKGLGLGACSFDGKSRFQSQKNLTNYMQGVAINGDITIFQETLTDTQAWLEMLMLGLRQIKGVKLDAITQPLKQEESERFLGVVQELLQAQLVQITNGYLALKPSGLAVVNEVIVQLSRS